MNYVDIRDKIKSGDIVALTHHSWSSLYDLQIQAVRIFTESEYAHVAVVWVVGGRVFLIESVTPTVRIRPLSNLKDSGFYLIPSNVPMLSVELEFLLEKVGVEGYSKLQAVEAQLGILDIGKDNLWECAELVIAARKLSGLDLNCKATPSAVVQAMLEKGASLQYVKNV